LFSLSKYLFTQLVLIDVKNAAISVLFLHSHISPKLTYHP